MATLPLTFTHLLTRFSFPKQPGDQPWSIIDVNAQDLSVELQRPVVFGGQEIFAQDFGLQSLDFVAAMAGSDGRSPTIIPMNIDRATGDRSPVAIGGTFNAVVLGFLENNPQPETVVRLLAIGH